MRNVVTSRIIVGKAQVEALLKKELVIPKNAEMEIIVKRTGSVDRGNYKEVLDHISFEWKEDHQPTLPNRIPLV